MAGRRRGATGSAAVLAETRRGAALWDGPSIQVSEVPWFRDALVARRGRAPGPPFDPILQAPIWVAWRPGAAWRAPKPDLVGEEGLPPYWTGLDLDGYEVEYGYAVLPDGPKTVRLVSVDARRPHRWDCSLFDLFELEPDSLTLCRLVAAFPADEALTVRSAVNLPRDQLSAESLMGLADGLVAAAACLDVTGGEPGSAGDCVGDALGTTFLPSAAGRGEVPEQGALTSRPAAPPVPPAAP